MAFLSSEEGGGGRKEGPERGTDQTPPSYRMFKAGLGAGVRSGIEDGCTYQVDQEGHRQRHGWTLTSIAEFATSSGVVNLTSGQSSTG